MYSWRSFFLSIYNLCLLSERLSGSVQQSNGEPSCRFLIRLHVWFDGCLEKTIKGKMFVENICSNFTDQSCRFPFVWFCSSECATVQRRSDVYEEETRIHEEEVNSSAGFLRSFEVFNNSFSSRCLSLGEARSAGGAGLFCSCHKWKLQ